jgi:inorganic pyrophosphatase
VEDKQVVLQQAEAEALAELCKVIGVLLVMDHQEQQDKDLAVAEAEAVADTLVTMVKDQQAAVAQEALVGL